jgi:hypothetical protein
LTPPGWAWALLTWLVVVAAASTFGWLAISRAGERVLASPVALPAAGAVDDGPGTAGTEPGGGVDGGVDGGSGPGTPSSGTAGAQGGATGAATPGAEVDAAPAGTGVRPGPVLADPAPPTPTGRPAPAGTTAGSGAAGGPTPAPAPSTGPPAPQPTRPAEPAPAAPAPAPPAAPPPPTSATPAGPQRSDRSVVVTGGQVRVTCTGDVIQLNGATPSDGWVMQTDVRGTTEVRVEFLSDAGKSKVRAACASGEPVFDVDDAGD